MYAEQIEIFGYLSKHILRDQDGYINKGQEVFMPK